MNKGQNIGYIRVSTVEQNAGRQLDGIELDNVFVDKCSGKDVDRPQLTLLLGFVRDGDTVFIHSMDRLARNREDLHRLVNLLTGKKVKVHFIKENLIFTGDDSPMSKLLLGVMAAFAEFDLSIIKERQREGIANAQKIKGYRGRKKVFSDEQVAEIKQLVLERYKIKDIAVKFKVTRKTIYQYLK